MKNAFVNLLIIILCFCYPAKATGLIGIRDTISSSKKQPVGNIFEHIPGNRDMFYTFDIDGINDSTAHHYKSLGVTSIESYVTWETCERGGEGKWDWSEWDI